MTTDAPVDAADATDLLTRRYGNRASGVVEIGRGAWATAYGFTLDGEPRVARFALRSDDFAKDRIAAAYASPDLPIPCILEIGDARGGFYAVSERVYGNYLDALDEAGMRVALPSLFAAHDAMRLARRVRHDRQRWMGCERQRPARHLAAGAARPPGRRSVEPHPRLARPHGRVP